MDGVRPAIKPRDGKFPNSIKDRAGEGMRNPTEIPPIVGPTVLDFKGKVSLRKRPMECVHDGSDI